MQGANWPNCTTCCVPKSVIAVIPLGIVDSAWGFSSEKLYPGIMLPANTGSVAVAELTTVRMYPVALIMYTRTPSMTYRLPNASPLTPTGNLRVTSRASAPPSALTRARFEQFIPATVIKTLPGVTVRIRQFCCSAKTSCPKEVEPPVSGVPAGFQYKPSGPFRSAKSADVPSGEKPGVLVLVPTSRDTCREDGFMSATIMQLWA